MLLFVAGEDCQFIKSQIIVWRTRELLCNVVLASFYHGWSYASCLETDSLATESVFSVNRSLTARCTVVHVRVYFWYACCSFSSVLFALLWYVCTFNVSFFSWQLQNNKAMHSLLLLLFSKFFMKKKKGLVLKQVLNLLHMHPACNEILENLTRKTSLIQHFARSYFQVLKLFLWIFPSPTTCSTLFLVSCHVLIPL
jgi:hypothetical protein